MKKMMRTYAVSVALLLMLGLVAATLPQSLLAMGKAETPPAPAAVISESRTISETTTYDAGLIIAEGAAVIAPEGKILTLTDAGVQKNIVPGTYAGPVVISVTDGYMVNNMGNNYRLSMAALINDGAYDAANSAGAAIISGSVTDTAATDVEINSQGDAFNGIVVTGNSTYTISNPQITLNGHGGDDFAGYGAGIASMGSANLTVENAEIHTTGAIRTAIWAGGNSTLLVKNSRIYAKDGTDLNFKVSMMNEVPWILGLSGNLRATNVLGAARATYLNSRVEAENWGSLSTDSTRQGAGLTAINTDIIVYGNSGYGSYADGAILNYYYGSRFQVPDMALIVAAGACGATFAKSSEANVGSELYNQIPAGQRDAATIVNSGSFGVMWHKNQNGVTTVKENSVLNCGETVFLIKSDVNNTAYPIINVDDSTLNSKTGMILHLMESDDAGMGGGPPGSPTMWAKQYVIPIDTVQVKDVSDPTAVNDSTVRANFSNMEMEGDIYNTRFSAGQNVGVTFDNATITGVISAGTQTHALAEPGEVVTKETYYKLGHVNFTPSEAVCNGVIVNLKNGSVWNVTGTSHITGLTVDATSSVVVPEGMKIIVNGKATSPDKLKGSSVTGNIVVGAL